MLSFSAKASLPPASGDCHEEQQSMMLTPVQSADCLKHFLMKEYVTRKKAQAGNPAMAQERRALNTGGFTKFLLFRALFSSHALFIMFK